MYLGVEVVIYFSFCYYGVIHGQLNVKTFIILQQSVLCTNIFFSKWKTITWQGHWIFWIRENWILTIIIIIIIIIIIRQNCAVCCTRQKDNVYCLESQIHTSAFRISRAVDVTVTNAQLGIKESVLFSPAVFITATGHRCLRPPVTNCKFSQTFVFDIRTPDSIVGIINSPRAWWSLIRFPLSCLFSPRLSGQHWGPPSLPFNGFRRSCPGGKRAGSEDDQSPPSSAEFMNDWSYNSTPPLSAFVTCTGTAVY